jgi:hypothetical protein
MSPKTKHTQGAQAQFMPVRKKNVIEQPPFETISIMVDISDLETYVSSRGVASLRGEFVHDSGWRVYIQVYPPGSKA